MYVNFGFIFFLPPPLSQMKKLDYRIDLFGEILQDTTRILYEDKGKFRTQWKCE